MIIVPSFDLPHPDQSPSAAARDARTTIHEWEWLGFQRVQLMEPTSGDGQPLNRREAEELLRDIHIDLQVAGDVQSADDVDALIQAGATSVVLGSRAVDEPEWLASTVSTFPDLIVVETTARERRVRSRGWVRTLPVDLRDLAEEVSDMPLAALLIRFGPDAAIDHADLGLLEDLAERLPFPLQVIGGSQSLATLRDLEFRGVAAAIIDAGRLADTLDEQTLARTFVD
jgi:phosphoribosylformimino-5-aminoimidazole carboxamide ribonucleotide (ProFAR) isomerase